MNGEQSQAGCHRNIGGWCGNRPRPRVSAIALALSIALVGIGGVTTSQSVMAQATPAASKQQFSIPAGNLREALNALASQSGITVLYSPELVTGKTTRGLSGRYASTEALRHLLQGSGLEAQDAGDSTFTLRRQVSAPVPEQQPSPRTTPASSSAAENDVEVTNLQEVLVKGSQSINADIPRTRDAPQPYVVLSRDQIERSGAANVEMLLRQQLTMQTSSATNTARGVDATNGVPPTSRINLRGLGSDETLILVDGRRLAGSGGSTAPTQPDLNTIPLAAIERIEVLPATASGIYGGGATGGVINVVLRRDYQGFESKTQYGGYDHGGQIRRGDATVGLSFLDGKTNVRLSASRAETDQLLTGDREFSKAARDLILRNNPGGIYGSAFPPLGATTNIRSASGSNLTLRSTGATLGSSITSVPYGYLGPASDGGAAFLENAGAYNLDLPNTNQAFTGTLDTGTQGLRYPLQSATKVESFTGAVHHVWGPRVESFLELSASENEGYSPASIGLGVLTIPGTAPGNPFNETINVITPTVGVIGRTRVALQDRRMVTGLVVKLSDRWTMGADYVWSRTRDPEKSWLNATINNAAAASAVGSASLNIFSDTNEYPIDLSPFVLAPTRQTTADTTLRNFAVRLSGQLPPWLPAGSPSLSVLAERRDEKRGNIFTTESSVSRMIPAASQEVDSVYLETLIPVVSKEQSIAAVRLLEMQIAARYDRYRTKSATGVPTTPDLVPINDPVYFSNETSSTHPTLGIRYSPSSGLMVRASYSTGFLPPNVHQVASGVPTVTSVYRARGITDPLRGNELLGSAIQTVTGGNPDLDAERSESRSIGMIISPEKIDGLRVSVDWVDIQKTGNISRINPTTQSAVDQYIHFLPERVSRGPASDGYPVGPITGIDATLVNIADLRVRSLDFAADYDWKNDRWGDFNLAIKATRAISVETRLTAGSPTFEFVGVGPAGNIGGSDFDGGALKWTANGSLTWRFKGATFSWTTRYFDSYQIFSPADSPTIVAARISSQGSDRIPSQIYHDLYASYDFSDRISLGSVLRGLELQASVTNVLGKRPPIDVVGFGAGGSYSYFGDPRMRTYSVALKASF